MSRLPASIVAAVPVPRRWQLMPVPTEFSSVPVKVCVEAIPAIRHIFVELQRPSETAAG